MRAEGSTSSEVLAKPNSPRNAGLTQRGVETVAVHAGGKSLIAQWENENLKIENQRLEAALAEVSRREAQAQHLAHHDQLTGLPNWLSLLQLMETHISESLASGASLALIHIDLDEFKAINTQYGHAMGDKLLPIVAKRISASVGANGITCRYSGDEFVVMLTNFGDAEAAAAIADRIRTRLEGRYGVEGVVLRIKVSTGLAVYPEDGEDCASLLRAADTATYRNKGARARPAKDV